MLAFVVIVVLGSVFILKFTKDKTKKVSTLRLFIQFAALFAVFIGLILGPFNQPLWAPLGPAPRDRLVGAEFFGNQFPDGLSVPILACYYPSGRTVTCPLWQMQAYIFPFWNHARGYEVYYSNSGLEMLGIVFGTVIVMAVIAGRSFCGWLCPIGLYMDLLIRLRKVTRIKHLSFSEKTNEALKQSRYIIIAAFLILSVIFSSYAIFGFEIIPGTRPGGPLGTEAGIVGALNEPFCLVCPARPLCVLAECAIGTMRWDYVSQIFHEDDVFWLSGFYVTSINLSVLVAVTLLAFAFRRFWCRVCPLGAITAFFSSFRPFKHVALTKLQKDEGKCTKCGVCKRVCPTQVKEVYENKGGDVTVSDCMLCARCVEMCPQKDALKVQFAGKDIFKSRNWLEELKASSKLD